MAGASRPLSLATMYRLAAAAAATALALIAGEARAQEFTAPLYDFLSRPDIRSERITVTHYDPHGVAPGYIFMTPWAPEVQEGTNFDFAPSIYDNNGDLVWTGFDSKNRFGGCQVFFMTEFEGENVLAYYHFERNQPYAMARMLNDRYEPARHAHMIDTRTLTWSADSPAVNGLAKNATQPYGMDMHDFWIVHAPARMEEYPQPDIDPQEHLALDEDRTEERQREPKRDLVKRVAKRSMKTTALMTMGRVTQLERPFNVCDQNMTWVHSSGFQEVSLDGMNTLLFQWDPTEHIPINETLICPGDYDHTDFHSDRAGQNPWHPFDFFHRNSVDKDRNGDYILSARHTSTIYKISGLNGTILWRLGGRNSDFEHISEVPGVALNFGFQHHARIADVPGADPDHGILGLTLWDNSNNIYDYSNKIADFSAGKTILIDQINMRATLVSAYSLPGRLLDVNQGSHQILPNGNHIIGGGNIGMMAEYAPSAKQQPLMDQSSDTEATEIPEPEVAEPKTDSPSGELVFSAHYGGGPMNSYRAMRYDWHGYPTSAPALFGYSRDCPDGDGVSEAYYYVSWNGATEVVRWEVHGSDHPQGPFEKIAETHRTGFESVAKGRFAGYAFTVAYDGEGNELGGSELKRTWVPNEEYVDQGLRPREGRRRRSSPSKGYSCTSKRCSRNFKYLWAHARTCPGIEPPPVELDLITNGWTDGGWHINEKSSTVSVTKTYTQDHPPTATEIEPQIAKIHEEQEAKAWETSVTTTTASTASAASSTASSASTSSAAAETAAATAAETQAPARRRRVSRV